MTPMEQAAVVAICSVVTILTRFLPFILFRKDGKVPPAIEYLGKALPAALFAMLVVYCFKDVDFTGGTYGLPELISVAFIVLIHLKWRNMLLSLVGGVAFYLVMNYLFTTFL